MAAGTGLRERKKAQNRQSLHLAALRLFLEHGFDNVTVAQIAEEANVALTTLFTYFPAGKVALVFEHDEDRPAALRQAVENRAAGTDVIRAIEEFMNSRLPFDTEDKHSRDVLELIYSTPQLRSYVRAKWTDCEDDVASMLASCQPTAPAASLHALALFILECPDLAAREPSPHEALSMLLDNLRRGWGLEASSS